jgi:uncharacterized protein (DUF362 family)
VLRRTFLKSAPAIAVFGRAWGQDVATAGATVDTTPRVGIVLSSFTGSEDHDGTKIQGLADPSPVDADLSAGQIDAMLRKAISLGTTRRGGLASIVASDDWVVIKPRIQTDPYLRGSVTDLRVVRSLIEFLVEHKCGARFTIAEGPESKAAADGWTSYDNMIRELSRKYPKLAFDRVDLNFDEAIELPLRGKALAYFIPKTIQQCDRIISVAPLAASEQTGVSLSVANYWGIAPGAHLKLGQPDEVLVDLFSYHPADYAIVGGAWGIEGGGQSVHHNVLVAGTNAVSVDAVGAAIMGFDPTRVAHLALAQHRGFGDADLGTIWIRGNEIEQARPLRPGRVLLPDQEQVRKYARQ